MLCEDPRSTYSHWVGASSVLQRPALPSFFGYQMLMTD